MPLLLLAAGAFAAAPETGPMPDTVAFAPETIAAPDTVSAAQPADSTVHSNLFKKLYNYLKHSNEDKTGYKDFDFTFIAGPHYSSNVGFGLGLVAAGMFRIDKDPALPPSNVSLFGDVTTTGFFMLGIRGNTIFKADRQRLNYNFYFYSMPTKYWGIGYDNGMNAPYSTYKRLQFQFTVDYMHRIVKNTYIGVTADLESVNGKDFSKPEYLNGEDPKYYNTGVGAFIMYDTRDFAPNPYKGIYLRINQTWYPSSLGTSESFSRTELFHNAYVQVWKGGIMAFDLHSQFNYGEVPWTMVAQLGGPYRMRGYYQGQFRDNNIIEAQVELRQRIYGRNGIAVWAGAGNVFPKMSGFRWDETLPDIGLGYRWEFKKRINVRLDYGFGKGQSGFIFNINEAF